MCNLYYPKVSQLNYFLKIFCICHRWQRHRWSTLICEYLREFSKNFETVLLGYSGAGGKLIDEKNQKRKISWHCPFKYKVMLRAVVYLGWPIAPSYMSPNAGGVGGVSANEHSVHRSSNKLWRSNSIFNLRRRRSGKASYLYGAALRNQLTTIQTRGFLFQYSFADFTNSALPD